MPTSFGSASVPVVKSRFAAASGVASAKPPAFAVGEAINRLRNAGSSELVSSPAAAPAAAEIDGVPLYADDVVNSSRPTFALVAPV